MMNKSNCKHLKSVTHKKLDKPITTRNVVQYPNINNIRKIVRNYINIFNKKYERHLVNCVFKLLTTTNHDRSIRLIEKPIFY